MMVSTVPLNIFLWWSLEMTGHCLGSWAVTGVLDISVGWSESLEVMLQVARRTHLSPTWLPIFVTCFFAVTKYQSKQSQEERLYFSSQFENLRRQEFDAA